MAQALRLYRSGCDGGQDDASTISMDGIEGYETGPGVIDLTGEED